MSQVVIDGIKCSVTVDQLRQFDAQAAKLGITREQAATQHLAGEIAKGKAVRRRRDRIRRNASDTQASKEHLAFLRGIAEHNGFDWKSDYAYICTARAGAVADLEDLLNLFAITGNGRCAWRALRIARENELPIPRWVAQYLYEFSVKLDDINWGKQSAVRIAKELKLHTPSGRAAAVARFRNQRIRYYVASYMETLIVREKLDLKVAAKRAAEEASNYLPKPVASSTVQKWYRVFKNAIGKHTEEMKRYQDQVLTGWPVHPHPYRIERLPAKHRKPIE